MLDLVKDLFHTFLITSAYFGATIAVGAAMLFMVGLCSVYPYVGVPFCGFVFMFFMVHVLKD